MFAALLALALVSAPSAVRVDTADGGFDLQLNPVVQPQPQSVPVRVAPAARLEWVRVGTKCYGSYCRPVYGWRYVAN